ncbi:type ISP restriction/modification enzyme [Myroides sp. C8-3]|uniref:type ISP restriction/modification enzyme n=1 Tax=Myroides sp. C8-3 TaxID=3400533 RepID=UPI003D2F6F9A
MNTLQYISSLNNRYKLGISTEHTFRGDLQNLIESLLPGIQATNEPKRLACGAPDYVLTKVGSTIPIGYIEAKDIGVDLKSKQLQEQFGRYKEGLTNLIITDYLKFDFYRDGELTTTIAIGEIHNGIIQPIEENINTFESLVSNFSTVVAQTIRSAERLAELLAGKARLMADIIEKALNADDELQQLSPLKQQMKSFKDMLIHDINNKAFSDIYSQTIAYGMFAARYNDTTLDTFSRMEAASLIPKSNPFLRKLFQDIAGFDLDKRIDWVVDELVNVFLATDVHQIMKGFGKSTKMEDPIIHFYETFLSKYDAKLRKARGVWYTPQPVVNFIVRAVDDILKDEFGLSQGLADTSKTKIKVNTDIADGRSSTGYRQVEKEVHRVQILDPATGTGTFLAETVRHIHSKFKGMEGMWNKYVKADLIPRLNGFELLMASYAMAHLKMDMLLQETGYKSGDDQRFRIYLTNSLEEAHPDTNTLFSSWLSDESNQANAIKKDTPVMVIIGNPPYSGESTNKGEWIMNLMEDYKKEPGGKERLKERNPKMINDDYVKFIRFSQHFIEKNNNGIIGFVNPHGYLDNPTFRGMRWSLLKNFDKIYTIDLHGNSRKKEVAPDGSIDQNVFDIMQGVSINLFIKTGSKKANELGQVFHYDLYGKRDRKYKFLEKRIKEIPFRNIEVVAPNYLFVVKNQELEETYNTFFGISDIFKYSNSGIQTEFDALCIHNSKEELDAILMDLKNMEIKDFSIKYSFENKYDKLIRAKEDIKNNTATIEKIDYKVFNKRFCIYTGKSNGIMGRARFDLFKHFIDQDNFSLCLLRTLTDTIDFTSVFVSNGLVDKNLYGFQTSIFPLYLINDYLLEQNINRVANLDAIIVNQIASELGLKFTNEKEKIEGTFAPIDILDYIYAVLHSSKYRETYKEFLKVDFPRVPYPTDQKQFWDLVILGKQIRELHLLESDKVNDFISSYSESGDNIVGKPVFKDSKVYINDVQYFANVPEVAWNFYIGGYQPAQKWLKDRKDRELSFEDIRHYNQMIVALVETDRLMKEIDNVLEF